MKSLLRSAPIILTFLAAPATASLVDAEVGCTLDSIDNSSCEPSSATVIDPGVEFAYDTVSFGELLDIDIASNTITYSNPRGAVTLSSDVQLTGLVQPVTPTDVITGVNIDSVSGVDPADFEVVFSGDSVTLVLDNTSFPENSVITLGLTFEDVGAAFTVGGTAGLSALTPPPNVAASVELTLTSSVAPSETIIVDGNGPFTFTTLFPNGADYEVTISDEVAGGVCRVANGSGTIPAANVTDVQLDCASTTPPADVEALRVPTMPLYMLILTVIGVAVVGVRSRRRR